MHIHMVSCPCSRYMRNIMGLRLEHGLLRAMLPTAMCACPQPASTLFTDHQQEPAQCRSDRASPCSPSFPAHIILRGAPPCHLPQPRRCSQPHKHRLAQAEDARTRPPQYCGGFSCKRTESAAKGEEGRVQITKSTYICGDFTFK
jgi:hypothetical protein